MIDLVKVGAGVALLGFVTVGFVYLFLGLAPLPTTPDEAAALAQVAMKAELVQGLGWILAGIGLFAALSDPQRATRRST